MALARPSSIFAGIFFSVVAALLASGLSGSSAAAEPVIRDAEIENIIRGYAAPLLNAADLDPEAFKVHIIGSDELNAFVARGQQLFITTGLLRRSQSAGQVMGVMAHEMGHIAGGHLARMEDALNNAANAALISQLLGVAIGALSGQPGAGVAVGLGGNEVAKRSFLSFSRGQEQAADQAAVRYLDAAGISSKGLLDFMRILQHQEFLQSSRQDPYLMTHPLTRERIDFVSNHVKHSPISNRKLPAVFEKQHRMMVAKLDGFLASPAKVFAKYKAEDHSAAARYARSIAFYREADLTHALPLVDSLIAESPDNPYFRELKGQMLFENGHLEKALPVYEKAVRLAPREPLLLASLAHVEVELDRPELLKEALSHLKVALRIDPGYPPAWRLAATAYGRRGQMGLSAWTLAEYNLLIGRQRDAHGLAKKAARLLKKGSPGWLRAQDIIMESSRHEE